MAINAYGSMSVHKGFAIKEWGSMDYPLKVLLELCVDVHELRGY